MLKLHVILGSTRPGRAGLPIGEWALEQVGLHGGFEGTLVDLAAVNLPMLDEPRHPRFAEYEHQHTRDWSATVQSADAFVIVTPEYNYSAPPALVNALDYLHQEWSYKPVSFVSYGGVSGGLRSVQAAKLIVTALKMMPIPEGVALPFFAQHLAEGVFSPPEVQAKAARAMLDELAKWATALKPLRG